MPCIWRKWGICRSSLGIVSRVNYRGKELPFSPGGGFSCGETVSTPETGGVSGRPGLLERNRNFRTKKGLFIDLLSLVEVLM